MTTSVRPAAVAGTFYPHDAGELADQVDRLLADAAATTRDVRAARAPKALIVPHAGYVYSGPVAASAYSLLRDGTDAIERVVLLGPAHRVALRGMAVPSVDAFETPLGAVAVDRALRDIATSCEGVVTDDRPHALEHSLEVHLPFLQRALPSASWQVLPVVVGVCAPTEVAMLLESVWGGPETLVVVSSDLSHYLPYDQAVAKDRQTAATIVRRGVSALEPEAACGAYPVRGLLEVAERMDLEVDLIDLRNSGDTAGTPDRVVGYGSFAIAAGR